MIRGTTLLKGIAVAILFIFSVIGCSGSPKMEESSQSKSVAFQKAMSKLWEDHILWTRQFIVSTLANLPDKDAATQRLLQNQTDIGSAIKPYYGDAAGEKLSSVLKDHILIAAEVVARLQIDWAADISAYEKVHEQILKMADMLSAGILKQFPDKFK